MTSFIYRYILQFFLIIVFFMIFFIFFHFFCFLCFLTLSSSFIFVFKSFFITFFDFPFSPLFTTFDPQLFPYHLKTSISLTIFLISLSLDILLKLSLYRSLNFSRTLVFPLVIFEFSYIIFINSEFTPYYFQFHYLINTYIFSLYYH
jgi:hypothetical protein